jgi:hypothetical protein
MESPLITHLSWGRIEVGPRLFKDAKLYPGHAEPWDWRLTGTRHSPGIQPADLADLLEHDLDAVVLSRGVQLRLQVQPRTLSLLQARGVDVYVLQTDEAVARYNALAATCRVGALIHSTC